MRKIPFAEHKKLKNLLIDLSSKELDIFYDMYDKHININNNSISKMFRMCETLSDIIKNNQNEYEVLFLKYLSEKSQKKRIEIRYGEKRLDEFVEKLKSRPRPKQPHSIFDKKFWMNSGLSEDESIEKVKEIQRNNVRKRTKESYKNFSEKLKFSLDYWTKKGYSSDEAEILRKPYLDPIKNDLESLIEKHGKDKGINIWTKRCNKYKESMKKNIHNRKTGGYVSKESLYFFIPLYKMCRRLGLRRDEIYFGINGSREFFIRDNNLQENGGKFYDFCIPKLKIIVEYHGTFWHPRNLNEWKNPWTDYDTAKSNDDYKKSLANSRNMCYHIVWSDDNHKNKLEEIFGMIMRKYNES
jgi:hypothetical protein